MAERFSKKAMLAYLDGRREYLRKMHGFDSGNGWAQVQGKGEALNRAYGEFDAILQIIDAIESEIVSKG